MKKFAVMMVALMLAILAIVPAVSASAEAAPTGKTMYVASYNGKGVRLRMAPSTEAKIYFNLGEGRPVTVYEQNEETGWATISVRVNGKVYNGFVMNKFLSKYDPSYEKQTFKAVNPYETKLRTASANGVISIWKTTSKLNENKLRDMDKTEKLTVLEESRAWVIVRDMYGNVGYVAKAYIA